MNKNAVLATSLLAGTIIGAGIFSLPYVFSRLGFGLGSVYLLGCFLVYGAFHVMYAEILSHQHGEHQFFFVARRYLPKFLSPVASLVIFGELIFALLVYLTLAPTFASIAFGYGGVLAVVIFGAVSSFFMFAKLSWLGFAEVLGTLAILGVVGVVVAASFGVEISVPFAFSVDDPLLFLLPLGPLLFSFSGRSALSEVILQHRAAQEEGKPFSLRRVVLWGTGLPAVVYVLFVASILRLAPYVSPSALDSLTHLSPLLYSLLGVLGLIALWTSYFMIGINVREILRLDLKFPRVLAELVAVSSPFILYFAGFQSFFTAVSVAGGLFLGLEGIFVTAMWRCAFPGRPLRWATWLLFLVFGSAVGYQVGLLIDRFIG